MLKVNTVNELHQYINEAVIKLAKNRIDEVESVSYGMDTEVEYKNGIYVSFSCTDLNYINNCLCRDILNQESLKNVDITLELAEKIAHYVSGLIGGKRVYRG